jgi:hypothetical protein
MVSVVIQKSDDDLRNAILQKLGDVLTDRIVLWCPWEHRTGATACGHAEVIQRSVHEIVVQLAARKES